MRNFRAFFTILGFSLLLGSCGDLGTVISSQGTYRVSALVDGDYTLDVYSIVNEKSQIRPYFVNSVVNDPDVRGLTVYVQNQSGTIVSRKVHYQLAAAPAADPYGQAAPSDAGETALPGTPDGANAAAETTDPTENPFETESGAPPADTALQDEASANAAAIAEAEAIAEAQAAAEAQAIAEAQAAAEAQAIAEAQAAAEAQAIAEAQAAAEARAIAEAQAAAEAQAIAEAQAAAEARAIAEAQAAAEARAIAEAQAAAEAQAIAEAEAAAEAQIAAAEQAIAEAQAAAEEADSAGYGIAEGGADTDTADSEQATGDIAGDDADPIAGESGKAETAQAGAPPAQTPPPSPPPIAKPEAETPAAKPLPEDQTIQVKQLDQYLPAFRIFEGLEIGRYSLVFQVQGEKEVLYKTSKPFYFLADADFALDEIQSYLPGTTSGGRLIPPGINVMLEADISADGRLDPYVIWYAGKKIIAQGRASNGANYLLWKTPDQTGFHIIRAEVFPLLPEDRVPENMIGKVKDLSLAISSKAEGLRHFSNSSGEFVSWYQLWGNLEDAVALRANGLERQLVHQPSQAPRWVPYAGMYGLLVSPEDVYALPGKPLSLSEEEQGAGRILFRFAPLAEGTILNARFTPREAVPGETADAAVLDLSLAKGVLTLRLSIGGESGEVASLEESLSLNQEETAGFITAIVKFDIAPQSLGASLILENPARETKPMALALDNPINGDGTIRLGSGELSARRRRNTAVSALTESGTAIFNEMAIAYVRRPISQPAPGNDPALAEPAFQAFAELSAQIPTAEEASPPAL